MGHFRHEIQHLAELEGVYEIATWSMLLCRSIRHSNKYRASVVLLQCRQVDIRDPLPEHGPEIRNDSGYDNYLYPV